MKLYTFKRIAPLAALVMSLGMGSCVGDLDVTPIDPSTVMTPNYNSLFAKCYANIALAGNSGPDGDCDVAGLDGGTTGFVRQLWNANELTTDEAICSWGDEGIPAFNFNQWGASHPMLRGFYYRLYFGITLCNNFLAEVGDNADAMQKAEIRFLRAYYYYNLMDCFGNVPFMTTVSSEAAPQYTRKQIYDFIENELAGDGGLEADLAAPMANTYGRVDKAAAWMLLARLYLNAEVYTGTPQWQKAADYAEKVMNSGYTLFKGGKGDWSSYQMLFMGDNGENGAQCEAIFPILQNGTDCASYGTTLFIMASCFKNDMDYYNGSINGTTEQWGGNRCRPDLVAKFFPGNNAPTDVTSKIVKAAGDDRALFWGKGRTLDVTDCGDFTNGFSCTKFTNFYAGSGSPSDSKFCDTDFFAMRAAEAYLTYAEATARLNGGQVTEAGKAALNDIRDRAHARKRDNFSMNDILDEWSREFYFEGRRRVDLIRFGYFGGSNSYRWQWKGGTMAGTTFKESLNIFAIPDTDLNANSNLKQNPGY